VICVALLRGINVGKAKRVAMADLKKVAESLGYTNVRTLLNSGNMVFTAQSGKPLAIGRALEKAIESKLGVASRVTVLTAEELEAIARANPLAKQATDPTRLLVTILADSSFAARLSDVGKAKWKPEAFALGERAAYLWCPPGQLDSPLARAVFKALGEGCTSRNWATIEKLRALVSNPPKS
jgi:uncharacterized protein (DUF1697 family)